MGANIIIIRKRNFPIQDMDGCACEKIIRRCIARGILRCMAHAPKHPCPIHQTERNLCLDFSSGRHGSAGSVLIHVHAVDEVVQIFPGFGNILDAHPMSTVASIAGIGYLHGVPASTGRIHSYGRSNGSHGRSQQTAKRSYCATLRYSSFCYYGDTCLACYCLRYR